MLAVAMPNHVYNRDWIGGAGGIEMTANALRRVKIHLEKGEDIRIRSIIDGVTRFARVSQGKEDHGRTGPDGLILSVVRSKTVTEEERVLNPLIQLIDLHGAVFVSRSGAFHDSLPTAQAIFLMDSSGDQNDLMLPQPDAELSVSPPPVIHQPIVLEEKSMDSYLPSFNWTSLKLSWQSWAFWLYGWIEDARHAPVLILLGKGWTIAISNPILQIPMILISVGWAIQALNLTFSGLVKVTMESAGAVLKWIAVVVDDFFEGSPLARIVMGIGLIYVGLAALSGCFYCMGSLIGALFFRWWNALKRLSKWCCRSRSRIVQSMPHPDIIPSPKEALDTPSTPQKLVTNVDLPVDAPTIKPTAPCLAVPIDSPIITLVDAEKRPKEVAVVLPSIRKDSLDSLPTQDAVDTTDYVTDNDRACQAHLIALTGSGFRLHPSPCNGKRLKPVDLLAADDFYQGGRLVPNDHVRSAMLCGKHRETYYPHRDAVKCQRADCWCTGIIFQLESGIIRECVNHVQERLNGVAALPSSDSRRASKCRRRESVLSRTSTASDQPTFGSSKGIGDEEPSVNGMESSSSSGLEIPYLEDGKRESTSTTSEMPLIAPNFAGAVRRELDELQKIQAPSDIVQKINTASRSPRRSVGSEESQSKEVSQTHKEPTPRMSMPRSLSPSEFDFETVAAGQRSSPIMTPWITPNLSSCQPIIGCAAKQMVSGPVPLQLKNSRPASNIDELSGVEGLMPKFVRRRSAPASHQVVTDEIDAEMYDADPEITSMRGLADFLKAEKEEGKDEPWTRLNELATFALCGFGQFNAVLAVGVYNKERKASLLRQGLTERDRLWDRGIRVPIGNRIAHGAATMCWGSMTSENVDDNTLLVTDFIPVLQEAYEKFQPEGKKNEIRKKQVLSIEKWVKAAKQHTMMFGLLHGLEHQKERAECILEMERVHEARPDLFSVETISAAFEEMNYVYCAQIREGTRKIMRLGGEGMKKPAFARIALNPTVSNKTRWEYPTVFLMHHDSGLWLARIVPRMEEKVSKATWKALTEQEKRKGAGGSGADLEEEKDLEPDRAVVEKGNRKIYPSGKPLRLEERDLSRKFRPKSTSTGDYLCWDFSSHAGCNEKGSFCSKGKHEMMSTKGLHYSILMQLARRGGLKASRRIEPEKIDGYIQALRGQDVIDENSKKVPPVSVPKNPASVPKSNHPIWIPKKKAGGSDTMRNPPVNDGADVVPAWMARKYGSGRFLTGEDALENAVSRAQELATELTVVPPTQTADEPQVKRAQWSAGRELPPVNDEVGGGRIKSWHWGKCALPLDFRMIDFTDLEDNARKLFYMQDDWLYQDEVLPEIADSRESSICNRKAIEEWWKSYKPQLNEKLIPCIKDLMDSIYTDEMPMGELFAQELQQMIDGGSVEQKTWAIASLEESKLRMADRAGNTTITKITFGPRMKGLEFETQEISFGALHFIDVDMGEEVKLNPRMQRALGWESVMEGNQCVVKHIAMGMEWIANNRHVRVPSRNRVDLLASELRMGEYQNAIACLPRVAKPSSLLEYEMWPNAHDSMNAGHDRNFKRLGWLMKSLCAGNDFCIRIFDAEFNGDALTTVVYQFNESFSEIALNLSLNLIVMNNHLRFLQPSKETSPGSWKAWKTMAHEVKTLPCVTWEEALEADPMLVIDVKPAACRVCGVKCKLAGDPGAGTNRTCANHPLNDVDIRDEPNLMQRVAVECWDRHNPWIHESVENEGPSSLQLVENTVHTPWRNKNRSNGEYPVAQYEWRIAGGILPEALDFHTTARQEFSAENAKALVVKGDLLVKAAGSLEDALFHFQEPEFREQEPQLNFTREKRGWVEEFADEMMEEMRIGVTATYTRPHRWPREGDDCLTRTKSHWG